MKPIFYSKIKPGLYSIEEDGRVFSHTKGDYMKTTKDKDGYTVISLKNNNDGYSKFGVYRLVMIAFCPVDNMEQLQVNHIDGNKDNNHISNLEWCTVQENLAHAERTGLHDVKGEKHGKHKITEEEAKEIIRLHKEGVRMKDIITAVPNSTKNIVNAIVHNRTWKHLPR